MPAIVQNGNVYGEVPSGGNIGKTIEFTVLATGIASSTKTAIASVEFTEDGLYIIKCGVRWVGNTNGVRMLALNASATQPQYDLSAYVESNSQLPPSSYTFNQQFETVMKRKKGDKLYLWAFQTSGADLGLAQHMLYATRIV